ncbi:MAG: type I-E CRISPR-associated protein Cas6/Cse3/CasE [Lentisphaeria bacterium]|nr:type I-E CRISPR-associated protein Cas6/Cse3/CasE [Lentisphaeria bacterium]
MMYLTKIHLSAAICRQENLRDAYSLHRMVYSFFPKEKNAGRFLYADLGPASGGRSLLILSAVLPAVPETIPASSTELSDNFFQFERFRFKILLNPVRRDPESRKRRPVTGALPLLQWFTAHAPKWGFEADPNTLDVRTLASVAFPKNGTDCRFHRVEFRGTLKVADPALFREHVENGIGHGKAFGFGLLQLVPVQQ